MKQSLLIISATIAMFTASAVAQTSYQITNFDFDGSTEFALKDASGTPIANGTTNGTGNLVQIGYFSNQVANNASTIFDGSFVALGQFFTGDSGSGTNETDPGIFFVNMSFSIAPNEVTLFPDSGAEQSGPPINNNAFPQEGMYLVIRWYDTQDTSGRYNSVSSSAWQWIAPGSEPNGPDLDLFNAASLVLESTGTTIASGDELRAVLVPEPGLGGFALAGLGALVLVRRRRKLGAAA